MAHGALAMSAAAMLDRSIPEDFRGPRSMLARRLLATWLDTGRGNIAKVREAVAWLRSITGGYSGRV